MCQGDLVTPPPLDTTVSDMTKASATLTYDYGETGVSMCFISFLSIFHTPHTAGVSGLLYCLFVPKN